MSFFRVPPGYNPHDLPGQIVDEGYGGRIVDPISGETLFDPNTDPNETFEGVAGTDQGFSPLAIGVITSGLYNAQFDAGPPDGEDSQVESLSNEIPCPRPARSTMA